MDYERRAEYTLPLSWEQETSTHYLYTGTYVRVRTGDQSVSRYLVPGTWYKLSSVAFSGTDK